MEQHAVKSAEIDRTPMRRRRRRHARPHDGRRRQDAMRLAYFFVATLWGFLVGTGFIRAVLPTAESAGARIAWMAAATALALFGGFVAARAYREVVSRRPQA